MDRLLWTGCCDLVAVDRSLWLACFMLNAASIGHYVSWVGRCVGWLSGLVVVLWPLWCLIIMVW